MERIVISIIKVCGVRSFILAFSPDDVAYGGVVQPEMVGNFVLLVAMFEMCFMHGLVAKCFVGPVQSGKQGRQTRTMNLSINYANFLER